MVQCKVYILTAGKSSQLAPVMRQTHTPGPLTRALTLALCLHLVWAGPQQDQRDDGKAFIHIHDISISFIQFFEINSHFYSLLVAELIFHV